MHDYEIKLLTLLNEEKTGVTFDHIGERLELGTDQILWAIENLLKQNAVAVKRETVTGVILSDEGRGYLTEFPEENLVKHLASRKGSSISEIKSQIALTWCKKNGWITIDKGVVSATSEGLAVAKGDKAYATRILLDKLAKASPEEASSLVSKNKDAVDFLLKRGLIELKERSIIKGVSMTKTGAELLAGAPKEEGIGALTKEVIKKGGWENQKFRKYDVNAPFEPVYTARLHPLRELMNAVRQNWLEMGFVEVSGPIIEASFWNFDALFSPQDHPTRDMQDTFFLSNPKQLTINDLEVLNRVKKMHVAAWKEKWSEQVASRAVLRTHTTSVSARYMNKLASAMDANYPLKLFSIGSVFRNESVDYKHLAELHQYDGVIIGDNLSFANLIDTLKRFYSRLGFDNVKMRPSYFPFTEPSFEMFYHDEEHGDSIELVGGGIIRKEITKAMGINKTVLAWGGGLERLLLNGKIFGVDSILTPYKNNLGWLRSRKNILV